MEQPWGGLRWIKCGRTVCATHLTSLAVEETCWQGTCAGDLSAGVHSMGVSDVVVQLIQLASHLGAKTRGG